MADRFDQPLIAVDVVPVSFSYVNGLCIGTARRQTAPAEGELALPGVLLAAGERLLDAGHRALAKKAGVGAEQILHTAQIGSFDDPGRETRDHSISIAFLAVVDPGAGDIDWAPVRKLPLNLPFHHDVIVTAARAHLSRGLWSDADLTRALLSPQFSTTKAAELTELATGVRRHAGNFHRELTRRDDLIRVESGVSDFGRPPTRWEWAPAA